MNKKQDQLFSIETSQIIYTNGSSDDSMIKNVLEICQMMDKNSSIKTPEFVALVWKFIYNHA